METGATYLYTYTVFYEGEKKDTYIEDRYKWV